MNNSSIQEYYDVKLSFVCSDLAQTLSLLTQIANLYGYKIRKTTSNKRSRTTDMKVVLRMSQNEQLMENTNFLQIEKSVRKLIDVLSIEMERLDEDDFVWHTKITKVECDTAVLL